MIEIVEEGVTVVEIVTSGPQGPAGNGFKKPVRLAAGSYTALDGDILILSGTSSVTMPLATSSAVGVTIRADGGTVTLIPVGVDTVEVTVITSGQSVTHAPAINEWVKL